MNLDAELNRFHADSSLENWVVDIVHALLDQTQKEAAETGRLSEQIISNAAELASRNVELASRNTELHAANIKIQALVLELARYRRIRFGAKSEAVRAGTIDLFNETLEADIVAAKAELARQEAAAAAAVATGSVAVVKPPRPPRAKAGRQPLPDHLTRCVHIHEPVSCTCGKCNGMLVKIGDDITEQLDVIPTKFFVHRHIRPQYACRACETVTAAPIPPAIIDGGMAATGLLVWIIISKYLDHLPLYRLEQIAARSGVPLAISTQADWVGRIGVALQPLSDRLAELLRQRAVLHADETPVAQLDPGGGKTKRAYLWAYRSNVLETGPPIVVFDYQVSRAGEHVRKFLAGWKGSLMVDDYSGYKALFAEGVVELGCLAHARRKFFDLNAAAPNAIAQEALARIAALYEIEARGKGMWVIDRLLLRQWEALPLLESMHEWLKKARLASAHGGGTAKAIDYSLKRWAALSRYVGHGALPIDNNPVENVIRPIAIGKKNWLFMGSERAGQRAAVIQGLLATAKLNGLDPAAWLRDTLDALPTCKNHQIDTLLPLRRTVLHDSVA